MTAIFYLIEFLFALQIAVALALAIRGVFIRVAKAPIPPYHRRSHGAFLTMTDASIYTGSEFMGGFSPAFGGMNEDGWSGHHGSGGHSCGCHDGGHGTGHGC